MNLANKLNARLSAGGFVQISGYGKSTIYTRRNLDCFSIRGGDLHVRRGHQYDCLSIGDRMLCAIRTGWIEERRAAQ